jgi:hypothetical protein
MSGLGDLEIVRIYGDRTRSGFEISSFALLWWGVKLTVET